MLQLHYIICVVFAKSSKKYHVPFKVSKYCGLYVDKDVSRTVSPTRAIRLKLCCEKGLSFRKVRPLAPDAKWGKNKVLGAQMKYTSFSVPKIHYINY